MGSAIAEQLADCLVCGVKISCDLSTQLRRRRIGFRRHAVSCVNEVDAASRLRSDEEQDRAKIYYCIFGVYI